METKQITLKSGKIIIATIIEEIGGIIRVDTDADLTQDEADEIAEYI